MRDESWFDTYDDALPVAGIDERLVGGTLRYRMGGTPAAGNLRGKTGTLTGVTALSGYVTDADGRGLGFSMISNTYLGGPAPSRTSSGSLSRPIPRTWPRPPCARGPTVRRRCPKVWSARR